MTVPNQPSDGGSSDETKISLITHSDVQAENKAAHSTSIAPLDDQGADASSVTPPDLLSDPPNDIPTEHKSKENSHDVVDHLTASMATLKPTDLLAPRASESPQHLTADSTGYVDPTPATPITSQPPSRTPSAARSHTSTDRSPVRSDSEQGERHRASEDDQDGGSKSEIQSIMEQFSDYGGGPDPDEVMSPRVAITSPLLGNPIQHPPRRSSLEPLATHVVRQLQEFQSSHGTPTSASASSMQQSSGTGGRRIDEQGPPVPPKDSSFPGPPSIHTERSIDAAGSPASPILPKHRPPPPEPEPEPALPFDFHRFLEQLRNKKADPVARYLKSFLSEFGKKQWMVHEQVKIISDFLAFIANKMMQCEVWRDISDAEFDNACEGMEKLVMNRLYTQTFSPAIPSPKPIPGAKPRRKGGDPPLGPGRRGQHQDDIERDNVLTQKINIYGWVKEEHLDIQPVNESGRRFLRLAQQELLKIKSYRAPRDKIICVLNCCKVIFGLLKHNKSDSSAVSFMPLLIYAVLHSNPEHLVSNVQYILRFRNQDKLGGEAGYYLSSLTGAIQFIEGLDRTSLTISDDDFEHHVEAAVSAIAEKHLAESPESAHQQVFDEKGALATSSSSRPAQAAPSQGPSLPRRPSRSEYPQTSSDNGVGDNFGGLFKTIQKPLSTIGRMFAEDGAGGPSSSSSAAPATTASDHGPIVHDDETNHHGRMLERTTSSRHTLSAEEAAARQASAEVAEAQKVSRAEHSNVVETLAGMFPDLDREVISDVVYQKEGRVGLAVDACLALST